MKVTILVENSRLDGREDLVRMFQGEDEKALIEMGHKGRELLMSLQGASETVLANFERILESE